MSSTPKSKKNYSRDSLLAATAAVKNGESILKASKDFSVPYTTLHNKLNEKYNKERKGPNTALSYDHEAGLAKHLIHMAQIGCGFTRKDIRPLVGEEIETVNKNFAKTGQEQLKSFKGEGMPSMSWVYRFLSRWPDLSARTPENLGYQRNAVTEEKIRNWFDTLGNFLQSEHGIDAKEFFTEGNASRVFNLDESGFPLAGTSGKLKIVTQKGDKSVYKMTPDSKEQVSVLTCASADGIFQKPYVIYPGKKPKYNLDDVNPEDFDLGRSVNGWMTSDCFFEWLVNCFHKSIRDKLQFPVVVFLDGHSSHVNISVARYCSEHNIILYCLPPHASHILQPLDVAVFGPMKKAWNDSLDAFSRKYRGLSMSRTHFFPVFNDCWKKSTSSHNVIAGFRKCGLVPFNKDAVAYDRILKKSQSNVPVLKSEKRQCDKERVGMIRMHQKMLSCIPPRIMDIFLKRTEEGYDIEDDTALCSLWKIYKSFNNLLYGKSCSESITETSSSSTNVSGIVDFSTSLLGEVLNSIEQENPTEGSSTPMQFHTENRINDPLVSPSSTANVLATSIEVLPTTSSTREPTVFLNLQSEGASHETLHGSPILTYQTLDTAYSSLTDISFNSTPISSALSDNGFSTLPIASASSTVPMTSSMASSSNVSVPLPIPSTSSNLQAAYETMKMSPFKNHIVISENVIINRKETISQTTVPFAISGKEYVNYLEKKQEKKKRELDEKEKRKVERENKRQKKQITKPNRKNSKEGNVQNEMILDDSDDDLPEILTNICQACLGGDGWDQGDLWIGCSGFGNKVKKCNSWFHKLCLSVNFSVMNEDELSNFELLCETCKSRKKMPKKKC